MTQNHTGKPCLHRHPRQLQGLWFPAQVEDIQDIPQGGLQALKSFVLGRNFAVRPHLLSRGCSISVARKGRWGCEPGKETGYRAKRGRAKCISAIESWRAMSSNRTFLCGWFSFSRSFSLIGHCCRVKGCSLLFDGFGTVRVKHTPEWLERRFLYFQNRYWVSAESDFLLSNYSA